ncbi:MAG: hypothetical protein K2G27_00215 [Duncaniella sp.]|nr:hypothetical protein [Duncaniella sp.]
MNSETKTITAKEAVKDQIASTLRHVERKIAKMAENMNADYFHFFEWHAGDMYKEQKRRAFYAELTRAVETVAEDADLAEWMLAIASRKSNELVRGSLTRNSTSQMANIAHLLNLEAEQEIIRELESLAHVANYHAK